MFSFSSQVVSVNDASYSKRVSEQVNRKCRTWNTMLQRSTLYTDQFKFP